MSKEKGKTIGLFVDPEDYELYISLGLRQRKEALASAKQALLSAVLCAASAMGKPVPLDNKKAASVTTTDPAAITHNDGQAATCVNTAVQAVSVEKPECTATNIDAKGFLDGGW
ncbi:hypothetical protein [Acidithiobacillus ferriphilus]|uniref:hypothetical protein n=1 Tax=Acidithiobacillus ferriphilus TaxID=1689834 RepID=UPI001C07CC8E|nr:hypothetical protein [Acidithiobacillus ferriphilus]MBU2854812.1 hypothetical protein [Acidithiobacillus ferriphilus]